MCTPIALAGASLAVGIAQTGASYLQQSQAAARQNTYYAQNQAAAQKAAVDQYSQLGLEGIQERGAASEKEFQANIAAAKARGTALATAGAGGVEGLSVDALLNDYHEQQAQNTSNINANYRMQSSQIAAEETGAQDQAVARINSVQTAAHPSPLTAIAGVASAAAAGGQQYFQDSFYSSRYGNPYLS